MFTNARDRPRRVVILSVLALPKEMAFVSNMATERKGAWCMDEPTEPCGKAFVYTTVEVVFALWLVVCVLFFRNRSAVTITNLH